MNNGFSPFGCADHACCIPVDILKRAGSRIVGFDRNPVMTVFQECCKINFVVWPGILISSCRTAADISAIDAQTVQLIGCDEERSLFRNLFQFKIITELGMAVVEIQFSAFGPEPAGMFERNGRCACH